MQAETATDRPGSATDRPRDAQRRRPKARPAQQPPLDPAARASYDEWVIRFRMVLILLLGAAVLGIGGVAFLVSFDAIKTYAAHTGGIAPKYDWAAPLLVDSFIAVATGADLWFAIGPKDRGNWQRLWPKLLLAVAAVVSFVLNIAHAKHTWAARGVAALPPAALVLSVELLMLVVRQAAVLRAGRLTVLASEHASPTTTVAVAASPASPVERPALSSSEGVSAAMSPSSASERAPAQPGGRGRAPGGGRRRPTAAQMQAARQAAQRIFTERGGRLNGAELQQLLQAEGHDLSERSCFGLLRELREQPVPATAPPGGNGQRRLDQVPTAEPEVPAEVGTS